MSILAEISEGETRKGGVKGPGSPGKERAAGQVHRANVRAKGEN